MSRYMYYLLGYKIMELPISEERKDARALNTFLLALDGDIDFQPDAVAMLVSMMKKNKGVGAACGGERGTIACAPNPMIILKARADNLNCARVFVYLSLLQPAPTSSLRIIWIRTWGSSCWTALADLYRGLRSC